MRLQIRNFTLREFTENDSIEELTALLNLAYKKWQALGFNYSAATQTARVTLRRLRGGSCFIALDKDQIVATITYHGPGKKMTDNPVFSQPGTAIFGQLAVHPLHQNAGIAGDLIAFVEGLAQQDKAKNITIDTAENNTWLVNYYLKKGYRIIDHANWTVTNYRSVILRKELSD